MSLWPSNDLSTMLCHHSFLVQCLISTYWKLLIFLESIWSLFNSKTASRVPLIIFIALMVSPTTNWRAWPCQMGLWLNLVYMCCYSSFSTNHVGCPIMTLNFTTRSSSIRPRASLILTISDLIFSKKTHLKDSLEKRAHCQKTLGGGRGEGGDAPSAPPAPEGLQ